MQKIIVIAGTLALAALVPEAAAGELERGVLATFEAEGKRDALVLPNFWFYQPEGEPPTSFLPDEPYTAQFTGLVSVDLRGRYSLQAELNGELAVAVNGESVWRTTGEGGMTGASKSLRLNKGTNLVVATFTPPRKGPAQMRLYWIPHRGFAQPIPTERITLTPAKEERHAAIRRGRALFTGLRCVNCHQPESAGEKQPARGATEFAGIGTRLSSDWMARWIANPQQEKPGARMPKLLQGSSVEQDASAIAAFLSFLDTHAPFATNAKPGEGAKRRGEALFTNLLCTRCHAVPGQTATEESGLLALDHVGEKYLPGALGAFLLNPQRHDPSNRMPNFRLTSEEAADLASYLRSSQPNPVRPPVDTSLVQRGQSLVQTSGCLNCHSLELENRSASPALSALSENSDGGCLAAEPPLAAASFSLSASERDDLKAFVTDGLHSLGRETIREFALGQTAELNCAACHSGADGFTRFSLLGEKFDPAWSGAFISGDIAAKPRPWLSARMPSFPQHGAQIARGLAVLHGFPAEIPQGIRVGPDLAEIGRALVSPENGFSCTACHAVGASPPAQVFEAPGINLAQSGRRLRKSFFRRWMLDPLAVDSATKMPAYFEEGRSPLMDVFNGDAEEQIDAIWAYLRQQSAALPTP